MSLLLHSLHASCHHRPPPFFFIPSSSMAALRFSTFLYSLLCLSLLLLLLHPFLSFRMTQGQHQHHVVGKISNNSTLLSSRHHSNTPKLLTRKNDFKVFHVGAKMRSRAAAQRPKTEIHRRYDVEKRLVPTGPNPLHH